MLGMRDQTVMMNPPCKKCLLSDSGGDAYEKIKELLDRMPENEKAAGDLFARRLDICRNCDKQSEGTCLLCGCYVELRAAGKNGRCPGKKWS